MSATPQQGGSGPIPVVLHCDPGHDDVFAIWLAAGHPEIDLRAITTVCGNALGGPELPAPAVEAAVTTVRTRLDIELHGAETVGATSVDLIDELKREPNARVATGLYAERFWKLVEDTIRVLA
ncbi:inosine-uridine preferring nucleoside hydrolase [Nonomuraea polychroma]|uniref:Inosine-uridine preferring nucleoside hydrolase n=1 Tax=Nonomuraea polychroma TaxID=46176 RepID=A0A438MHM9_9ACTN|nr:nucleoside hydrolase [Nonomuraea polychroma]RVX45274.1 inosine-uridine preferring nucleoside hydrolase [Nonomuraea polychroma]